MKKLVGTLVFVLIIGAIGVFAFSQIKPFGITTNSSAETSLVQDRIVELSEWTTLKYEYSKAIVSRTDKNIPLTDINFAEAIKLIEYSGYLKAGSDLSKLEVSYDEVSEQLSVRVPKAQILDNVVETEKTTIEDVKGNIFSDSPTQKVFDDINADKATLEEEKISQGFLEEADKRTEELLTPLLSSMGHDDVIIEFY
ncbi:DUF4230 domain-containing protein [Planococcus sp. ISL-109]|uniref:DUF4230 domain-containing protein n=1 Tax=Planococcus sp. ISL-109 TaxID=2819166 RepID=UPI001BE83998|nr:DUF4230 domain-containing protein [Planococcus sp. ISL-109]MBT2583355.1 DUF4230 domain-containing protein [Planococcus sp. ISL-109]